MRILIDTNVFLEVLLGQAAASEAQQFLRKTVDHQFFVSDFSVHSNGLLLVRRRQPDVFLEFIADVIRDAGVGIVSLAVEQFDSAIGRRAPRDIP